MPRAALSTEEIAAFRVRAVAAATHLFGRDGYEAVTMRALASELGCSPMTPYRYFKDKAELFAAVRTAAFQRFADAQALAFDGAPTPMARLLRLQEAYVAYALREPDAYRIMFELSQAPAGTYPELDAECTRAFSYLLRATEEAVTDGHLAGDALTLAHLFWSSVHGMVSLHLAGKLTLGRDLAALTAATRPPSEQPEKGRMKG